MRNKVECRKQNSISMNIKLDSWISSHYKDGFMQNNGKIKKSIIILLLINVKLNKVLQILNVIDLESIHQIISSSPISSLFSIVNNI
jgi:hypothetical protein